VHGLEKLGPCLGKCHNFRGVLWSCSWIDVQLYVGVSLIDMKINNSKYMYEYSDFTSQPAVINKQMKDIFTQADKV